MIVFKLTMPNVGSWNGRWSGERDIHIITQKKNRFNSDKIGKDFWYDFGDGWSACISVYEMDGNSAEYRKLKKNNKGFCGYDWMVRSIVAFGKIRRANYEQKNLCLL